MSAPTTMQWIRGAARRLSVGSSRLCTLLAAGAVRRAGATWRRARGWLGESSGLAWLLRLGLLLLAAAIVRKAAVAVAVALYARAASGAAPGLLWGAAAAWVIAAYRVGREDWAPKRRPVLPAEDATGDEEQPTPEPVGPRLPTPAELVGAVREIGTPHAHLKALAEHLGTTTERVREAAGAAGLPVTDVRMGGRPSTGVRGDALPYFPSPASPPDVVGAGQPANNDNNNAAAFETVPDEENPVRTHVIWSNRAAS